MNKITKKFGYNVFRRDNFKKAIIKIAPSARFGGIGVFAIRNLKKGTIIGEPRFMGEDFLLKHKDYKKIDKESKKRIMDFCANSKEGFYVPRDINYISIPWHMNHCCDGNVSFDLKGNFITIKSIKKNEELCYDYGLMMSYPRYKLICICKSEKCRKIVTGNDWKDKNYAKKNFKQFSPEIKYLIKSK